MGMFYRRQLHPRRQILFLLCWEERENWDVWGRGLVERGNGIKWAVEILMMQGPLGENVQLWRNELIASHGCISSFYCELRLDVKICNSLTKSLSEYEVCILSLRIHRFPLHTRVSSESQRHNVWLSMCLLFTVWMVKCRDSLGIQSYSTGSPGSFDLMGFTTCSDFFPHSKGRLIAKLIGFWKLSLV